MSNLRGYKKFGVERLLLSRTSVRAQLVSMNKTATTLTQDIFVKLSSRFGKGEGAAWLVIATCTTLHNLEDRLYVVFLDHIGTESATLGNALLLRRLALVQHYFMMYFCELEVMSNHKKNPDY